MFEVGILSISRAVISERSVLYILFTTRFYGRTYYMVEYKVDGSYVYVVGHITFPMLCPVYCSNMTTLTLPLIFFLHCHLQRAFTICSRLAHEDEADSLPGRVSGIFYRTFLVSDIILLNRFTL